MPQEIDQFLNAFLVPPPGQSPQSIKDRCLHWIDVCNEPEKFTTEQNGHALAAKRRSARQCLRRLAERHPEIVAALMQEHQSQRAQVSR